MLVRKFSFAPMDAKIQMLKSHCYLIHGCAVWRLHANALLENMIVMTHSNDLLMCRGTPAESDAPAIITTDHINMVLRKSACSLMSRVTTSLNSIVTAVVNSDVFHQPPLMDKWESIFYRYRNNRM